MTHPPLARTRKMHIVAQDPAHRASGPSGKRRILTAAVDVPAEALAPGPRGYRVHVVDYDSSAGRLYPALDPGPGAPAWAREPSPDRMGEPPPRPSDDEILEDPRFHALNTYAIVMRTLARFEYGLGRRVGWGFQMGHQLKVAPHAFSEPNAFYSRRDEALLFGYFPSRDRSRTIFTCLSHDIVAHETAHAILDGLRNRFTDPSSLDQAAFHEGFADIVALLSVFGIPEVVERLVDVHLGETRRSTGDAIHKRDVQADRLRATVLLSMAEEFGQEQPGDSASIGRGALRHSVGIEASPGLYADPLFFDAHRRGELLVAAVLGAFIEVWAERLARYFADRRTEVMDRARAAEEGVRTADYLLTMAIRALDYCPPTHVLFGTYLSALLTADFESNPNDPFHFREHLLASFQSYGIEPMSCLKDGSRKPAGTWEHPDKVLSYDRARFEPMQRDREEVFRFAWENRKDLSLIDGAYTRVLSVRPCVRTAPEDGFIVHETVAEILQQVQMMARELVTYGIRAPPDMPPDTPITLYGGVTLIFDEYGRVKYAVGDRVFDPKEEAVQARQAERLDSLWQRGHFRSSDAPDRRFARLHQLRAVSPDVDPREEW